MYAVSANADYALSIENDSFIGTSPTRSDAERIAKQYTEATTRPTYIFQMDYTLIGQYKVHTEVMFVPSFES